MADSKECSTDDYIEVNTGDNDIHNGSDSSDNGNDNGKIDDNVKAFDISFDEEGGGGVATRPYSKIPKTKKKDAITVTCTFFVGFILGALCMSFGGSKLGWCSSTGKGMMDTMMHNHDGIIEEVHVNEQDQEDNYSSSSSNFKPLSSLPKCETKTNAVAMDPAFVGNANNDDVPVAKEGEHREVQAINTNTIYNAIVNAFTVLEQVGHDSTSFTQGLSYGNGMLYETTGLNGRSKVNIINPETFIVEKSRNLEYQYFGEGSTYYTDADGNHRLISITWKKQTGWIYDATTLERLKEFQYTTTSSRGDQGWGITYDASKKEFIVSDGSQYLYFWDRDTLEEKRYVTVMRFDGREQENLNELEFMDGLVCCNIWYKDVIICVDPETGKSVREYDMSSLWPKNSRNNGADVLNGIALAKDHVLITGKKWSKMFKVDFPDWPTLFGSAIEDEGSLGSGVEPEKEQPDKPIYAQHEVPKLEQPESDDNVDSTNEEDTNAVSYNFLRTTKGSQTLHNLMKELLKPTCISEDNAFLSGPRRALAHLSDLMESDSQILSSCHPFAHNLGRAAYQYFGGLNEAFDGMIGTKDAHLVRLCNAAYLHGVIESHLRGVDDVRDLASAARTVERKVCKNMEDIDLGAWECRHGIGHGIIQRHRMGAETYAIIKGIATCNLTSVPEDCENGLWMDHFAVSGNIMSMETRMMAADVVVKELKAASSSLDESQQGENVSTIVEERFKLPPLPSNLQICSLGSETYGCFIYAASEYLLVNPGDYHGALQYCTDPSANIAPIEVQVCVEGVGAQCAKENMDDFSILEEVCQRLEEDEIGPGINCFEAGLNYYYMSGSGSAKSLNEAGLCDNLTRYKDRCQSFLHSGPL